MCLSQQTLISLLDYDPGSGAFTWKVRIGNKKAGTRAGSNDGKGYTRISINGRRYKAHRLAWLHFYGEWPTLQIDHINRNGFDNSISNLRLATVSQNNANRCLAFSNNTSGIKGVSWHERDKRWVSYLRLNGRLISLGSHLTKGEAEMARSAAEKKYFGSFAAK